MGDRIQHIIAPEVKDLGGVEARRLLPSKERTLVGPFIFFDHLGPATFPPNRGVDVRPHPHIGLATVTYLFEGVLLHRDSLGSVQEIHPGAVNWMTAGRGITHSERTPDPIRVQSARLHGIQTWVALPDGAEEMAPHFEHYPADGLPTWETDGVAIKLIAGEAFGRQSPVKTASPMIYLDVQIPAGQRWTLPAADRDCAIYSVTASLSLAGEPLAQHRLAVLQPGAAVTIAATQAARCIVVGGDPVGDRIKWWNFVSSRRDRIEQAKADWQAGRFPAVPEETEFIPLPEA